MPAIRIRFDEYEIDLARRELRKHGSRVGLQRKPFRVLELLLQRPGELVTREELCRYLWPDSHVSFEHSLNTAINSLRQALGESSRDCRFIETRPGVGYRFCAAVEEVPGLNRGQPTLRTASEYQGAYEDCLRGRFFLDRMCEEDVYKAIGCFNSASANETCFPLAHAGIADAYCQLALLGSSSPSRVASRARSAAEVALRLAPDLADAHVAVGRVKMIFDWDWTGAREAVTNAIQLDPASLSAHGLKAALLRTLGHYEEATQACSEALAVDPLSFSANLQLADCLYAAGDFAGTIDQCWKILTLAPRFAPAQIVLAMSYQQSGLYEEALVEFENAQSCVGFEPVALSGIGHSLALRRLNQEAEQTYLKLSRQAAVRYVAPYCFALVNVGRSEEQEALSHLEMSFRQRDPALLSLRADPRFQSLREHDRFQSILRGLGVQS